VDTRNIFEQIVVGQVFGFFHCKNYPGKNGKKLKQNGINESFSSSFQKYSVAHS
jgi:hypothetical protein